MKPSKRRLIQVYTALLYNANIKGFITGSIYTGNSKLACLPGLNCYSCPGAVGACPLGSLQNALAASHTRAPVYVLGIIVLFGLILGRTICGFLCPVGLGQELLYKIKTPKLKKSKFTRILSYLKYVILIAFVVAMPIVFAGNGAGAVPAFCKYICPAGTFEGAIGLLSNPANGDQFAQLNILFTWKMAVLIAIIVACIFIFRSFCRFLCPLGAIYGFFSKIALLGVKLDKNKCTDCGLCIAACKMDIKTVGDHECIQCGECMKVCPAKAISWKGSKLFVKENQLDAPTAEGKPLTALLAKTEQAEEAAEANETVAVAATPTAKQKETRRNKILEGVAWGLAGAVLVGSLVYFNFIEQPVEKVDASGIVGKVCPDFTLSALSDLDEDFSLSEAKGKVVVLNFWHVNCSSCIAEMPEFNELQEAYADTVEVVIVYRYNDFDHRNGVKHRKNEWSEFSLNYVVDTPVNWVIGSDEVLEEGKTLFESFGGTDTWPQTVILDEDGVIRDYHIGSTNYEKLSYKVNELLGD